MSFRLFMYYCALVGGWSALIGWLFGQVFSPSEPLAESGIRGMFLGMLVALGLSLVDALWNFSFRQLGPISLRVSVAVLVGAVGGLVGGIVGFLLYDATNLSLFFVVGWALTGLLIGASIGAFELVSSLMQRSELRAARHKLFKCVVGGAAGGLFGGAMALLLKLGWLRVFADKNEESLWSPTAMGFVGLGMCIGLLVGLAQVILKEAWVRVEAGFRRGREIILTKERTAIGRAEDCDIGLFGDSAAEKHHASIVQAGSRFYLENATSNGGTFVNDQPVKDRVALRSGDLIRLGKSMLRFNERPKRTKEK
jgi:hypothetical protein